MYGEIFVDDMSDLVFQAFESKGEKDSICFIAKYDEAAEIIKEVMQYDETCPFYLELFNEDWNGYDKEFMIVVDDEDIVFCEPLFVDGIYLSFGEYNDIYILEDCNSKLVEDCPDESVHVIILGDIEDDECDGCCENCKLTKDENIYSDESTYISKDDKGNPTGFTKSWFTNEDGVSAYSSYSFHCDDNGILKEIADNFGIRL